MGAFLNGRWVGVWPEDPPTGSILPPPPLPSSNPREEDEVARHTITDTDGRERGQVVGTLREANQTARAVQDRTGEPVYVQRPGREFVPAEPTTSGR